jgi:hypothetical protein
MRDVRTSPAQRAVEVAEQHHRRHGTDTTARAWALAVTRACATRTKAGTR